jgi:hypothetical protein
MYKKNKITIYTSAKVSNIAKIKILKQKLTAQKKQENFKESKQTLRRVKIFPMTARVQMEQQ